MAVEFGLGQLGDFRITGNSPALAVEGMVGGKLEGEFAAALMIEVRPGGGTGKGLKAHKSSVEIFGVEPSSSAVITTGTPGKHKIQGIGAGFVPQTFLADYVDKVLTVSDDDAFDGARLLADRLGLLVGISSGAAFSAAYRLAKKPEYAGKLIVALLPDTGERYLSTALFDR